MKVGKSVNKPPILDGTNHEYQNVMRVTFLNALGIKEWKDVIKIWKHPVVTSEVYTTFLKPEADWRKAKDDETLETSNALNDLLKGVDKEMLKFVNTC